MARILSSLAALALVVLLAAAPPARAEAPGACAAPICWEIVSRFRFFKEEADFLPHEKAWADTHKADPAGAAEHPVALMQRQLAGDDGANWAFGVVNRTCFDDFKNELLDPCTRDGASEKYIKPAELPVRFTARLGADFDDARCVWAAVEPAGKNLPERRTQSPPLPCDAPWPTRLRPGAARVSVTAHAPDGKSRIEETTAAPRDILVVGMGDSVASGEGNPERPVRLRGGIASAGFCFQRFLSGARDEFFMPTREFDPNDSPPARACPAVLDSSNDRAKFEFGRARWLHAACHRSLYGHQLRTALALAIEDAHRAVTYIPLGCSGATIREGLLKGQSARERLTRDGKKASAAVFAQAPHLKTYLNAVAGGRQSRAPDLLLLSVGANDIGFSGLVADVSVSGAPERKAIKSQIVTVAQARKALTPMTRDFAALRQTLKPVIGGDMSRVVFVPYGNPALDGGVDHPCPSSHRGFDLHPGFGVDGAKLAAVSAFVEDEFIKRLLEIASCDRAKGGCANPARDRMAAALTHRAAFEKHGFCAAADTDPAFDRDCLLDGGTRNPRKESDPPDAQNDASNKPLSCPLPAAKFAPYAPRARWVRTSDDSALAAMSFSDTLPLKPAGIHDALWGLSAVVYGGAIHPTAEGHAAMADAALVEARKVLEARGR
jgi:hypothetical protein